MGVGFAGLELDLDLGALLVHSMNALASFRTLGRLHPSR
jgi:hypothetical protein